MDCLEFRRVAGADPGHLEPAARAHAEACPRCGEHLRELRELDARILAALQVSVPATHGARPAARRPGRIVAAGMPWRPASSPAYWSGRCSG